MGKSSSVSSNNRQKCIGRSWYRVCWNVPDPWKAVGSIRVYDDVHKKYIPVKGARVRVWRWFNVHEVYTNSNGYFDAGEFIHEAQYEVIWERYHYAIKAGRFSHIRGGYYPPAISLRVDGIG